MPRVTIDNERCKGCELCTFACPQQVLGMSKDINTKGYFPARVVQGALRALQPLRLAPYGPEQVDFLRYRPVLSNRRLKEVFGYVPQKTTAEVFDHYWRWRQEEGGGR